MLMKTTIIYRKIIRLIDFLEPQKLFSAILGWIFGYPFSLVIKRDPCLKVVIARQASTFADNSKYFFIYAHERAAKDEKIVFLTPDRIIKDMIVAAGGKAVLYPSLHAFYLMLKCNMLILDWLMIPYIYPLTHGAKLIQIWHGAPLKHIEMDIYRKGISMMRTSLRLFLKFKVSLIGRYPVYDIVVATSQEFIKKAFYSCFTAKEYISVGYPRNDILFGWPSTQNNAYRLTLINVDDGVLEAVNSAKSHGKKICLYVPTFRKDRHNPLTTQIDLSRLSKFAVKNTLLFILKLHPNMYGQRSIPHYPGLIEYTPLGDVYPLMPLCDLLITDYSSIYFDFLLLDRPILFFAYDLERYLAQDRDMYFDYHTMTPGSKCRNYNELESEIESIIANGWNDGYGEMREKVRGFTHDHTDNQSHLRLLASI